MTIHVRVLTLAVCLSVLIGFAAAAGGVEIRRQAPCIAPSGFCLRFEGSDVEIPEIPVVRTTRFNAASAGTAAVSFHGSLHCSNDVLPRSDRIIDLATQIVAAADAVPTVSGPGALRLASVLKVSEGDRFFATETFNLASTRVFAIPEAGLQTYRFKIAALRMDAGITCLVYNATFTVLFVPEP
jgi:hypothetical protein